MLCLAGTSAATRRSRRRRQRARHDPGTRLRALPRDLDARERAQHRAAVGRPVPDAGLPRNTVEGLMHPGLERRSHTDHGGRPVPVGRSRPCASRLGGDVIPSFGGYSADHAGTELADSCTNLHDLVAAYESVITTYGVTRLDMDVEDRSLRNTAGIDRRNEALTLVERWARRHHRPLEISYTLPSTPAGLVAQRRQRAAERDRPPHAGRRGQHHDLRLLRRHHNRHGRGRDISGQGALRAAARPLPGPLAAAAVGDGGQHDPSGIDDYPKKTEVTYPRDARRLLRFAQAHGIGSLSIWAIQRDNGGCPGKRGPELVLRHPAADLAVQPHPGAVHSS